MRTYPLNSPQAAARIVTLAMLADGDVSHVEVDALERAGVHKQLGLDTDDWDHVVSDFCNDLIANAQLTWADACRIDPRTLAELMAEIDDPKLRLTVLRLCILVVEADAHVDEGEANMIGATVEQWGLHREMLNPSAAALPSAPGLQYA